MKNGRLNGGKWGTRYTAKLYELGYAFVRQADEIQTYDFPNKLRFKQQNTQFFAGLARQLTELPSKSNRYIRRQI